jgi:hypothetical protein
MNIKKIIKEELDDSMDWIKQHSFHLDLMSQNPRKIEDLHQVKKILFNPAVTTYNKKFKDVAYYLEDMNYMPENLVWDYLSYIEITEHNDYPRHIKRGKFFVGPQVSDEDLLEMIKEEGSFWYEEFMDYKKSK